MDYRDEVFIAVAENLSFSKASIELHISQPAVTKHIRELENKLNATLFERKSNRIQLTDFGRTTYHYLNQIKQLYSELDFELGRHNNIYEGSLRIGASSTIAQYFIPAIIAAFGRRYPSIKISLLNGNSFDIEQKLLNNEIDIGLVENESVQANIKYSSFYDDEIVAVTGATSIYSKLKSLSINELLNIPIVLRESGSGSLEVIQNAFARKRIDFDKLKIFISLGSTESIKNFLADFDGIALLSEKAIEKELQLRTIRKIPIDGMRILRTFRTAILHGHELIIPKLFISFLNKYNK